MSPRQESLRKNLQNRLQHDTPPPAKDPSLCRQYAVTSPGCRAPSHGIYLTNITSIMMMPQAAHPCRRRQVISSFSVDLQIPGTYLLHSFLSCSFLQASSLYCKQPGHRGEG